MKFFTILLLCLTFQLTAQEIKKFDIGGTQNNGLHGKVKQTTSTWYGKKRDKREMLILDNTNIVNQIVKKFSEDGKMSSEKCNCEENKNILSYYEYTLKNGFIASSLKKSKNGTADILGTYTYLDSQTYQVKYSIDATTKNYYIETNVFNINRRDSINIMLYYANDTLESQVIGRYSYYSNGDTKQIKIKTTDFNNNSKELDTDILIYQYLAYDDKQNWTEVKIVNKHNNSTRSYIKREIEYYGE
jgi:hypothetical protein